MALRDDTPEDPSDSQEDSWTPARGLVTGTVWTFIVALILGGFLGFIAWCVPSVVNDWLINAALCFLITSVLFAVMHRTAGMAGPLCNAIAVLAAVVVLLLKQIGTAWGWAPGTYCSRSTS